MQKITPCLWFNDDAEEAVNFYVKLFKNSKIGLITRYEGEAAKVAGKPAGSVLTIAFQLNGEEFTALNGGPLFKFSEAISFAVNCDTQKEIDDLWEKLSSGGEVQQCGWLKDRFGLSWQIVPTALPELLGGSPEATKRVMDAIMQMKKLDIKTLEQAYGAK